MKCSRETLSKPAKRSPSSTRTKASETKKIASSRSNATFSPKANSVHSKKTSIPKKASISSYGMKVTKQMKKKAISRSKGETNRNTR